MKEFGTPELMYSCVMSYCVQVHVHVAFNAPVP